jgi:hypothetical protein
MFIHHCDPIGIDGVPEAADEYDSYIGGVYRLLASKVDADQIAKHIETESMGLTHKSKNLVGVAERLMSINVGPEE